jgi:hypothetical protein
MCRSETHQVLAMFGVFVFTFAFVLLHSSLCLPLTSMALTGCAAGTGSL